MATGASAVSRGYRLVHSSRYEAIDLDINDLVVDQGGSVPDLRHCAMHRIRLGPAMANIIDDGLRGDIVPFGLDVYLIGACPVRLLDSPPIIVTQNVPVGLPTAKNFGGWLNMTFPPEMLGVARTDAGGRQCQRGCREDSKEDGGASHDRTEGSVGGRGGVRNIEALLRVGQPHLGDRFPRLRWD
jgi:hypothetical protein